MEEKTIKRGCELCRPIITKCRWYGCEQKSILLLSQRTVHGPKVNTKAPYFLHRNTSFNETFGPFSHVGTKIHQQILPTRLRSFQSSKEKEVWWRYSNYKSPSRNPLLDAVYTVQRIHIQSSQIQCQERIHQRDVLEDQDLSLPHYMSSVQQQHYI